MKKWLEILEYFLFFALLVFLVSLGFGLVLVGINWSIILGLTILGGVVGIFMWANAESESENKEDKTKIIRHH